MPRASKIMNAQGKRVLTAKQEKFCQLYVALQRPNVAYRMAYEAEKMGDTAVRVEVHRLLQLPAIATRVAEHVAAADKRLGVTIEGIGRELARIAHVDPGELVNDKGEEIPFHQLPRDVRHAIAGVDVTYTTLKNGDTSRTVKYRFASKVESLNILAKWKKMLIERSEIGHPGAFDGVSDADLEARNRADKAAMDAIEKAQASTGKKLAAKKTVKAAQGKTKVAAGAMAVPERDERD